MAQYLAVKQQYEDILLFYRMGDFYEMFLHDAEIASEALGIALTHRGEIEGKKVQMCGVPVHAADSYLAKLIKMGHRVAVCEQSETPEAFKKRGQGPAATRCGAGNHTWHLARRWLAGCVSK